MLTRRQWASGSGPERSYWQESPPLNKHARTFASSKLKRLGLACWTLWEIPGPLPIAPCLLVQHNQNGRQRRPDPQYFGFPVSTIQCIVATGSLRFWGSGRLWRPLCFELDQRIMGNWQQQPQERRVPAEFRSHFCWRFLKVSALCRRRAWSTWTTFSEATGKSGAEAKSARAKPSDPPPRPAP